MKKIELYLFLPTVILKAIIYVYFLYTGIIKFYSPKLGFHFTIG